MELVNVIQNKKEVNVGVYQINCNDCSEVYIGQAGRSLAQRVSEHKRAESGGEANFIPCADTIKEINSGEEVCQVLPSKITKRGTELESRNRHLTDESDVSSLRVDDGTTDHDGDIEDCSEHDDESTEPEHSEHLMYYPLNDDTASDFTVNAMDVEELRRSQRRHRKARPERPTDIPLVSVSGSQDSDDDEDEVSTPSADTAERNIMSMLSVSTESIDRVGRRENFLKTNFESLEGEMSRPEKEGIKNKNSISYKFNSRNKDSHVSSKREELLKRIEETRKKLQSIGYKSNLRSSKSISDLSNIPEKDTSYLSGNQGNAHPGLESSFYLPVHPGHNVNTEGSNHISQFISSSWVPPNAPIMAPRHREETGDYTEKVPGSFGVVNDIISKMEGNHSSGMIIMPQEVVNDNVAKIGSTVFDGSAVPRDQQRAGKELLAQLEKDLREFDLLMGCPSPPEVDADSLEETLRSLALLSCHDATFSERKMAHRKTEDDSDSDTVKSEASNFSCDSLEDENDEQPQADEDSEVTPRHRVFEAPKTLPLPRRKRQRWQRLSLGGITKERPNDYESDVFPTNEMSCNHHSQVFRTASDTALANSDSSHSDVQTPTNPPYFSVKSPVTKTAPALTSVNGESCFNKQINDVHPSEKTNGGNTVTTLTVETHSYRYERESSVPYALPRSPVIDQLRREASGETSPRRQSPKCRLALPPASFVEPDDFPVVQAQPLPPGPPPAVYLPCSQPTVSQSGIPTPGRAHRVLLAKKVTIQQVLPSKRKS
ncbi:mitogen-activated protein kinase binding protein 1 [Halocaridina rubra]|uniref:Mitogen-activated protein kinase binding protein 1 n=1 Tax=Halocaridina rubra TaxID=373956 RepID=A0AAN8XN26_HALRR